MERVTFATYNVPNFCVVGNPIEHSRSPEIHESFARQLGMKLVYEKVRVKPGLLKDVVYEFAKAGGRGLNVTTPLKEEAWSLASVRSERSDLAKAANTLWFEKGEIACDNTDGIGLVRDLEQNLSLCLAGETVLLLGAGGAARGVIPALLKAGVSKLLVSNRTDARAALLAGDYAKSGRVDVLKWGDDPEFRPNLIINATSASLESELPNVAKTCIHPNVCCYDLMYSVSETPFVTWAKSKNAALAIDGLGMLVEQAAESFKIWNGQKVETSSIIAMVRKSHGC